MSPGGKLATAISFGTAGIMAWAGVWLGVALFVVAGLAVIQEERSNG